MSDSSDYVVCEVCEVQEICLCSQSCGEESGLFCCYEGHKFCSSCFPEFVKNTREHMYGDIDYIRNELAKCIDSSEVHGAEEFAERCRGYTKLSDADLIKRITELDFFSDMFEEVCKDFCPICNREFITDQDMVKYLLKKVGLTKKELIKEMKNENNN